MRLKKLFFILLILTFAGVKQNFAQQLEGAIDFHGFVDNREYAKTDRFSPTYFGARFSPEIGLLIDSVHRFRVGVNMLKTFGSKDFTDKVDAVVYYQYQKQKHTFFIGAFPRVGLIDDYPIALLSDTLNYFRPNIEGMLYQYQTAEFKQNIWIDWTGKQTATDRETFLFGFSGKYEPGIFYLSHYAYMFHNALSEISLPNQHLEDNGAVQLQFGLDLGKRTFLDSLTISAGPMISIERTRNITGIQTPKGFISYLYAGYKQFSLKNTFYAGEGHHLINGDLFYSAKQYDRLDLGWTPISYKNVEGGFVLSFHFLDNIINSQQAFSLRYRISGSKNLSR
ncbi:hypothetical protein [Pedobacter arcticus]|uniref:hypothetical protein n=1 Tax=Pedobacter arcticus TaxID=752140 RepID=UPI0002E6B960|nr:hypothetical protein [Pedobacter arcticus]